MSLKLLSSARIFAGNAIETVDKARQKGYNKTIDGKGATRCKTLLPLPFFVYLLSSAKKRS